MNEASKPKIIINIEIGFDKPEILDQICYGVEEEGIPFQIQKVAGSDSVDMGYKASLNSILGVGIGVSSEKIVLHYEKLSPDMPLFEISTKEDICKIRAIGTNGARLVKRMPFNII